MIDYIMYKIEIYGMNNTEGGGSELTFEVIFS